MSNLSLIEKNAPNPQLERLKGVIMQKSYVVRNGSVSDAEADNALQAKRHQRRAEARAQL